MHTVIIQQVVVDALYLQIHFILTFEHACHITIVANSWPLHVWWSATNMYYYDIHVSIQSHTGEVLKTLIVMTVTATYC